MHAARGWLRGGQVTRGPADWPAIGRGHAARTGAAPAARPVRPRPGPGGPPGAPPRASAPSPGRTPGRVGRHPRLLAALVLVLAVVAVWLVSTALGSHAPGWRQKIASAALSQVGYRTSPPSTYCNQFSAYWGYGTSDCGNHNLDEEWCADFAAWTWNQAGVPFRYGQQAGQISSAAISFYYWGVHHGTWHPAGSGYQPSPGDVAVYGLDSPAGRAAHVAVVTGYQAGARGPDVVNGDGDQTGFSVVETGTDQYQVHGGNNGAGGRGTAPLSGYVAPLPPAGGQGSG